MAKTGGQELNVGIATEFTAGTLKAATGYLQWLEFSMQGVAEKANFKGARGIRNESSNSMIRRKYSQGSIKAVLDPNSAPYFFLLALGSWSSATHAGESAVYDHTITVQNSNVSMKTASIYAEQGAVATDLYVNCVCNSLNIEVSDEYATVTGEFIGKFPTSSSLTESFAQQTEFAYHQMTVKFGTSLSNAAGNSATPLKGLTLNINNNILLDEAFLSGANDIVTGGLYGGRLKVTGSYMLQFADTTELAKYQANTKNAMIISFTGANIGVVPSAELVKISLGKLILTKPPLEFNIDGLIQLKQEFDVEYDVTDKEITVLVTNTTVGTTYQPTS